MSIPFHKLAWSPFCLKLMRSLVHCVHTKVYVDLSFVSYIEQGKVTELWTTFGNSKIEIPFLTEIYTSALLFI
jgi:hypothetical protein